MLKNKKNAKKIRNIVTALIAIIMTLSVFIKIIKSESIEIKTIGINNIKHRAAASTIDMEYGTINPIYRPEWEKVSSSFDATSKKVTVKIKGSAYETKNIDSNVDINYASDVTSTLAAKDITVFIDGVKVTSTTHPIIEVDPDAETQPEITTNETTGKTEITHTIVISDLEEAIRQTGIPYKEWSGNIKLKIAGRGQDESTYSKDVLTDIYGNQSMMEIDESGTWIDVTFGDDEVDKNTAGTMFADFIRPEFTYEYANTTIDHNTKKVTVIFDVTDKYFANSTFTADDIIIAMIDDETSNVNVDVRKRLSLKTLETDITDEETGITYKADGSIYYNGQRIGQRYELVLEGLEQLDENGLPNGYTYSGPMSIALPSGTLNEDGTLKVGIIDNSGNLNSAKTITIGIDETDGNMDTDEDGTEQVVDVVDPIWEIGEITTNEDEKSAIIKLTAKDKYFKESTLTKDKIKVYVNEVESTGVVKNLSDATATSDGVEYTLTLSNLEPTTGGTGDYTEFTPIDSIVGGTAKYRNENGGNMKIEIAEGTIEDQYQNFSNTQEFSMGIIDVTSPEVYDVQKTKDTTAKTETIIFNVTDKNYDSTDLVTKEEITVFVDGEQIDDINKSSLTSKEIRTTINGVEKIVGHQYTLVLDGFESATKNANGYDDWSGTVSIKIAEDASKDDKGNTLNPATTTISDFVDFLKPVIEQVTVANPIDTTNKTYTFKFTAIDKYMNTSDLITEDEIKVYVDGVEATTVDKDLTTTEITKTFKKTVDGTVREGTYVIGHEYTLVLSGFEETDAEFTASGRNYVEWSGNVSIELLAGAVKDKGPNGDDVTPNTTDLKKMNGDFVDFIKPKVQKVSSERDATAKTETIIFNVMDKYLDTSELLADSAITVYVDEEETTGIIKNLTKVKDFTAIVNGDSTHVVGQQYQLVLSDFEKERNEKNYKDWSGTVSIKIAEGAVQDTPTGNVNDETTIKGDFVDFINPDLKYVHQSTDIDKSGKTYTMTFTVTDKYYTSGKLTIDDLTINMQNGQMDSDGNAIVYNLKNEPVTITLQDADLKASNVAYTNTSGTVETVSELLIGHTYTLKIENLEKLERKTGLTTADYSGVITVAVAGDKVLDRTVDGTQNGNVATTITSGVNIPGGTTPDDAEVVDVVDPIWEKVSSSAYAFNPEDKTKSIATITFKGTDSYFANSTLTKDNIKVFVNGTEVTTGITKTLSTATSLEEQRKEFGSDTTVTKQYGVQYTLTIEGWAQNANQVKIQLPAGTITDESGNGNKVTEMIVYNTLRSAASEGGYPNKAFLGNSTIQRQNIENVTFETSVPDTVYNYTTGEYVDSTAWDVSAGQDKSIIAWYETSNENGALTVHIGSNDEIFGNQDSSELFAHIGYADICTATEAITNIDLLNVSSVTDMAFMFYCTGYTAMTTLDLGNSFNTENVTDMIGMFGYCGYKTMTSIDLGDKFDTSNVTNMNSMFNRCGYTAMTSLDLGNKFDTGKVTNMSAMFTNCGYTAMTSLDLGDKFDTSKVINMDSMFEECGYTAMTSLELGDKFDTINVTDMNSMFLDCGYTAMTSLDLGDKFDTSKVTDMENMFSECGYTAMTSLNLGDKFDTSSVTNMRAMFLFCGYTAMTSLDLGDKFDTSQVTDMYGMFLFTGYTAMTSLDLGPAFTKIADTNTDFILDCGTSGAVIYAPESIYSDMTHFKLSTDSETTIEYVSNTYDEDWNVTGANTVTINPIYKPEWTKVSSALKPNATAPTALEVTVKGNAIQSQTVNGVNINYNSNVTSTLAPEDITVYINGVQDGDRNGNGVIDEGEAPVIQVAVSAGSPASTGTGEITHTITLTNFEEATRQLDADGNIKKFSEWSGNISIKIAGREEATSTYTSNVLTDVYGNQSMSAQDDTSGDWIDVIYQDTETDHNTDGTMFTDFIKPEFTYEYSETTIDYTGKTLTAIFYAADKYFDNANSSLALADLTIKVDGEQIVSDNSTDDESIRNTLTAEAYNDADGNRIGTKYTLIIKNLPRTTGDPYNDYSGPVTIAIPADKISDLSGNKNVAKTITIGVDDPTTGDGHNTEAIVDVVDPIWKVVGDIEKTIDSTTGEISVSMDIYGTDKYYKENTLTADQIELWIDGVEITAEGSTTEVTRTLTKVEDLTEIRDGETVPYGVHYKLTIGQIKESDDAFFAERAKYNEDSSTGRPYREYSGAMKVVIPANTITDDYNNKNLEYEIPLDHVDTLQPEVIQVSSESNIDATNVENSTQTIVFDVVDKYLNTSAISTTDTSKIHVLIDGEEAASMTKPSTSEEQANNSDKIFKEIVNIETLTDNVGGDANHLVGYRYTLKLSNFENPRTSAVYGDYTTWSGNLSIKVDANTATDTSGAGNAETELTGDERDTTKEYVDFVKPDVTYKYSGTSKDAVENPEINYDGKTYTMVFEITDKNFANSTLTIDDLDILIDGEEPNWRTASDSADTVGVIKELTNTDVTATVNGSSQIIGKRYTLTLSHLEQLKKLVGKETVDYSGVITVAIPANVVTDKGPKGNNTTPNGNDATTITSGIDIPGGDVSGDGTVVDVVDPIWEKVSSSAYAFDPTDKTTSTATITVKGTDKYYASSALTADKIKVFVNGAEVTDGSVTVTVDSTVTDVNASDGTRIGDQYTITVKGWAQDANQMKIQIGPGAMTDQSGNTNKATDLIVYNVLRNAATDMSGSFMTNTDKFLGNSTIQRQNIENVTFETSVPDTVYNYITGEYVDSTAWDVSAQQDKSIIAWYETSNENGALTVHIGSNDEIFGNQNSSNLFSNIGSASICTATEAITNINLLNVSSATTLSGMFSYCGQQAMTSLDLGDKFDTSNVTDMSNMFWNCGYTAMTSLDLGDKFDTSNVTNMSGMFVMCGYETMTILDLGDKFDTSNVTYMSDMFYKCGYTAMTSLDLGDKFDTSNVTNMSYMFYECGYTAMTILDLGDKFDTSNVTNMSDMFSECGYTAMTSLDLGDKFDTSKVTNMNHMFAQCGYTAMTSLDLGDLFYTTSATDMTDMFYGCGNIAMTSLDLGPAFTRIADTNTDFITNCGTNGAVIYAPESIYSDMTHLKLDSTSTTTIEYTETDVDGNATGTRGTINPIYKPEWTKESSTIDETNKTISIVLKGNASLEPQVIDSNVTINYNSNVTSTLAGNLINIYIDGELDGDTNKNGVLDADETTSITRTVTKDTTNSTDTEIYYTITLSNFEETVRQSGKNFLEWSGNISIQPLSGTLKDAYGSHIKTDEEGNQVLDEDGNPVVVKGDPGNGNMQAIDLTAGTWTKVELQDTATDHNTNGTMFTDYIKPEFTYEYSNTTIDHGANADGEKVTIVFDVTDKYFNSSALSTDTTASNITVLIDDYDATELNNAITKKLTKMEDLTATVNGVADIKIGERYQLEITGLDQEDENGVGDGYTYSGVMTLSFPAGLTSDKSGNENVAKTITIGKDEPTNGDGHDSGVIVDVVDPVWTLGDKDLSNGVIKLRVKDKFLSKDESIFNLTADDITVLANGTLSTKIGKQLTGPVEITPNEEYEYTLTLTNIVPSEDGYTEFTPTEPIVGDTAKYKNENGGNISLEIAAGVVTDQYENSTNKQLLDVGIIDATGPEVYDVQKIQDQDNNKETIIFNVTDKNYDSSDPVTINEISIWINGINVDDQVTRTLISTVEIKGVVDGEERILGHQYTLEIGEIVETNTEFIDSGRRYRELSGTLEVKIDPNASKDTKGNIINSETTTITDFVDFIKPEVKYKYNTSDIDYDGKTFTMVFDITDKYFDASTLTIDDLDILIDGEEPNWRVATDSADKVGVIKELTSEDITVAINSVEKVVGKTYTLKLSHLEQLTKLAGKETIDYSGVITVAIPANKVIDKGPKGDGTNPTGNSATTITSGISIMAGEVSGDSTVVDVVDPIWEKVSSSASAIDPTDKTTSTATITVKGTDKYYASSALTADLIKVFVNGSEVTDASVTVSVDSTVTDVNASDGTKIGDQYTITVKGWAQDANQMKIQIQPGAITDESGNTNKATDLIVYNTLRSAASEEFGTSAFLGNSTIQRQKVENVTFETNIPKTVYNTITKEYVDSTAWDVSARQDKSIIAWYETSNENGALTVHIGSNDEIFANQDSSRLFSHIGDEDICTATEAITNIDSLNVTGVTNMSNMFSWCGAYGGMTTLNLGSNFDTSNVTDMSRMFWMCGNTAMTSLELGDKFDTSNVTNMGEMFSSCGYTAMTSLDLGDKFNTSNVTNMRGMFNECGNIVMTSLDLGDEFDTSSVTNMNSMFKGCGYTAMTSLDLGDKFDTSNVTDMNYMFFRCGYTAMTSLDLGDKFDTSNVTRMEKMFYECGYEAMTTLDLGPAFTKIPDTYTNESGTFSAHTDFITNCGKSGAIIYAPESIYNDITHLKLNTDSTTTIEYTEMKLIKPSEAMEYTEADEDATETRGTINPIYKPEWTKESSSIDEANKTLTVNIKGTASLEPQIIDSNVTINYNSKVTSTLAGNLINIYIDGELDGDTNKNGVLDEGETTSITRTVTKDTTKSTDTEIYYTITLSGFEETLRQSGKNFKEWSGNISIQPLSGTIKDVYGNGNMQAIDLTAGTWTKVELTDIATDHNTNGTMFTDYINPEFTYEYSNVDTDTDANTIIDYESKTVTVVFDVTDKYFDQANITADNMTIQVGGEEPDWTKSTKTLTKKTLEADKVVGDITYKANGDIYYTVNGTSTKIGERYELVVSGLETENGVGYSGAMTLSFPAGELNADSTLKCGIMDKSGNLSVAKTITIGIDEPENSEHPDHDTEVIVDVVNPLWTGPHNVNSIDRTNNTVDIKILGSDKYYASNSLTSANIKVYVDNVEQTGITKNLVEITDDTELQTLIASADLQNANAEDVAVGYTLTLGNFGELSGETKIVIASGTITDESGNVNVETTIPVGNIIWEEANEPLESTDTGYPRYPAFRQDIVDFIKPVIKYQYSAVEGEENPNIDIGAKTLTVKFTVTDKYLVESTIMNADGTLNTDNVRIQISTLNDSGVEEFKDITDEGITTTINSTAIADGFEYTLTVKNFELVYNNKGQYQDYSGIVQLVFAEDQIDDLSGNKNVATTITIDTGTGDDPDSGIVVDVIDPIIEKTDDNLSIVNSNNGINRDIENETGTVSVLIKATDKYLSTGTLQNAENVEKIKVKVVKPNGETVYPDTITKIVSQQSKQSTSITYKITLGNFGENEGVTSIIIPAGVITDTSGNVNQETEILVGNSTWTETGDSAGEYTAFRNSIVDFTRPTWEYSTSSITRNRDGETGSVTVKILGKDIYYLKDTLTINDINVYVANSETPESPVTSITKRLVKITDEADLDGAQTGYYLTLRDFGSYDGQVKISIAENTIRDTSGNGNKVTEMLVGNPEWVETDIGDSETTPKYTAFRNSIVDFIKPTIKYQYTADVNPLIDQENKQVSIIFDAVDTNFLESVITDDDIQIFVDDMDVTDTLTKSLSSSDISDGSGNGIRYTLTLSQFELQDILENETFKRHSGKIELVIAGSTVRDTSGNENNETRIIVDNDDGDDADNYVKVDFINPKIYYVDKFISWDNRYATITIAGTDRFYDFDTTLSPSDIIIYQLNLDGEYVQVTDLPITVTPVKTEYGYNFVVRLDDFEEEYKMKISIPAGVISDTEGHSNDATDIFVDLDNKKPVWKYVSTDTSQFESDGKISFNVKGQDKFLDLTKSGLTDGDVSVYRDGTDITASVGVTINYLGQDENEKSKSYKIDLTGLTEIGTYSLVLKEKTLIDDFSNESATTTITFSKSAIATNTDNYQTVTYHASPDFEQTHQAFVHELMSVNETGTNFENTTFRPSTIGEIYDDGKNTLFAEPFKYEDGVQTAYSFKGWAVANQKGFAEEDATIYGLYDEIPDTAKASDGIVHLKAVWQEATVVFVSNDKGDNLNNGLSPTTPVKNLQTAYSKINSSGTASTNIIVIMDAIEWDSSDKLTGNATITSLYAGVDYKAQGAELKISSNMEVDGDVKFDNIELYSTSTIVSDGSDYLANGSYTNMLITNYGDITLGRRISTPDGKYTFGAVVGGNYKTESTIGEIGVHTVIVEAGRYNNIVVGSALNSGGQTTNTKYVSHQVVIGNMKDAAVSRNDKLTITGYLSMGELEDRCYPYDKSGSDTANAYNRYYAITKIYSGTFTGENKFAKAQENASVYLRPMNGFSDGKVGLDMYGGNITGNVYGGARMATSNSDQVTNILNFYGGQLIGNMFGHGGNDTSTGGSTITLEGIFGITGNIFGGSNATTEAQGKVTGSTSILVNSSFITIKGNIYGGSNGIIDGTSINLNTGLITGDTNIVLSAGAVTDDIFGGGYNCGNTGSANITINNGTVSGSIYGGAYQNQVRTETNIEIYGGTVNAIYGGNVLTIPAQQNNDSTRQNANIIIGDTASETTPTVNGSIYGSGKYDKVGTTTINLVKCATTPTVYGGSDGVGLTDIANIYLKGMTVDTIYGGSNGNGTVTTANIYLQSGTATDVYGGGYGGTTTTSNVNLEGTATVTSIYGGANTTGKVETSNVTLKSGTVTNVFGGGNSTGVGTANVTLDGITIDTIHGGSKNAGNTTNTNVVLTSGKVTNVYGGGLDVGATNAKVTQQGATVTTIYGGNHGGTGDGGETTNSTVNINNSRVANVYGGNMGRGTTRYTTINITGASTITGKLYGGGYRSEIGKSAETGSTTINISGGTINKDIYGGSEDSIVYGTTNINIGKDAVTDDSLTAGNINIRGNIYGAGSSITKTDYSYTSVYGDTHITMDSSTASAIAFSGSIYGAGKGTNYSTNNTSSDGSTVKIKDFGTSANAYQMVSVQRTGKLYIGNSYLELSGVQDENNYYKNTSYTLNRITNGLAIHDNTTLYTKRGFNMVGGFESFKTNTDGTTEKENISISGTTVTRNVDNRLYTLEGINLIFAKEEGELSDRSNEDIWGDVNGMAFFGMYRTNRSTGQKEYDIYAPNYSGGAVENFFATGTYVEGRHKANHDTTVDGFYTNVGDYSDLDNIEIVPQVIDVTDYGTYYDWIVGADIVNYDAGPLIASTYSTWSTAELTLDYKYEQGAMYTVNRVSVNALNTDVKLINPLEIPTYATSSDEANNTFGLTMGTTKSGWLQSGVTNMYTDGNGSFDGTSVYKTDNSSDPGTIIFKIFNSANVTENKDLGNVNIVLTGKTRTGEDASQGNIFRVIIALNLQSVYEEPKEQYTPRFTDSTETELNYTTDSSIDMTYLLYETGLTDTIYASGDYRVLSSTVQLPTGTRITMRDYGQGDDVNKVYYYQVASDTDYDATETVDGKTRYLYRLDKFIDMGSAVVDTGTVAKYVDDNSSYYHSSGTDGSGYVLEKYDISIDLIDSNINTNQLAQETYLELRNSTGTLKYDNGDKDLTYNLYNNNATMSEAISNEGQSYSVFENLTIPFTFDATLLEQVVGSDGTVSAGGAGVDGAIIRDTKYYDKKLGLAIEIVDEQGERIKTPEVQNLKITNAKDSTLSYKAGNDGAIRVPLSDELAMVQNSYKLSLSQYSVPAGVYKAKVYFFASDDGLYYGDEATLVKEFNITFINRLLGLAGVESTNDSRIINKTTGLNLEGNSGLDLTVKVASPTSDTNIRVELYKRNPTYTVTEDESGNTVETYTGTQYTQVDLAQYLDGTWETPEDQGLVTTEGCSEYMVMSKEQYSTAVDIKTVEFEKELKAGISTGEYKLVFKAYYDNTLIQTVRKTFIVTP